ncbi:proline dehydrogenase 1, mitochondrial-like isoform X2 [Ostrea edulis]|uniref:proline dehydrogenase 1, mitochondrial-like isoform X2 n=1 Tax=Ostrea edulis TaxID=37623 RepID=UPI0020950C3E|nr:proline dehydrogenase 1, mitochondrial-like isoform X2 [Ostrea edulis]
MAALLRTALYRNVLTVRIPETKYVHGHFSQFGRTKFTSAQSLNDESVTVDDDSAVKHVPADSQLPALDLSFNSSKEAYRSKSTAEIARALFVFNMCSIPFLVNHNKTVLKWSRRLLGKRLFCQIMKASFYGQFVAGEDQVAIRPLVNNNRKYGVKSILDYSVEEDISSKDAKEAEMKSCVPPDFEPLRAEEASDTSPDVQRFVPHEEFGDRREGVFSARTYFYEDETKCDENLKTFKECIDAVAGAVTDGTGFIAIKMTALGRPQFLLQLSDVITSWRNFFEKFAGDKTKFSEEDFKTTLKDIGVQVTRDDRKRWFALLDVTCDGEIDLLDWDNLLDINTQMGKHLVIPNVKTGEIQPLVVSLQKEEEEQLNQMLLRLNEIAQYAIKKDVRVMVDAEQTYFQPAISRLTIEMMRKFNKEKAVIFNTYQCYLKKAYASVKLDLDLSKREDFYFGAKIVRGAYMEQERERAVTIGYEDPIQPTFGATSLSYHSVMEEIMNQINQRSRGKIAVMVASHNEDTVKFTVEKMKENNIGPHDRLICFGQLLGMCDHISFPLGQAEYSVYKYVPYGPVEEVLPYLSRRAMENRGVLKKVKKEKRLLWKELLRRVKNGELRYNPTKASA